MSKRICNVFKEITKMLFLYKKNKRNISSKGTRRKNNTIRDILFIDMKGLKIE